MWTLAVSRIHMDPDTLSQHYSSSTVAVTGSGTGTGTRAVVVYSTDSPVSLLSVRVSVC